MRESDINREIVNSLKIRYPGSWVYKIPDAMGGYSSPKPFDIICITENIFTNCNVFALETKLLKKYQTVNINMLRPSQIEGLTKFLHDNRFSFVLFVFKFKNNDGHRVAEMYRVPIDDLLRDKSYSYDVLKSRYNTIHFKNGVWEL